MARSKVSFGRHLKDRRFSKNENLIIDIYIRERKNDITARKIAKKTKLGRSTIYAHHRAVKEIIPDYENYILALFTSNIKKKIRKKNVALKFLYLDMLLFILRNKKIFRMFLIFNDREIISRMIGKLEKKITSSMRLPKNSQKIFKVYTSEVTEVIFAWGRAGFSEGELTQVLSDIMYLTSTCTDRLNPINHE